MILELLLSFVAVIACFLVLGFVKSALFAVPLLVWGAYRLGRASRDS